MTTERIVIAAYKPFPGKEEALRELMKTHVETLRSQGLVTGRTPITMQGADGIVLEVFGWKSKEAIESAHANPVVQEMWEQFGTVCEFIPAREVPEMANLFSEFDPL